jgi:uncharacterized alpha-E superfamily protein
VSGHVFHPGHEELHGVTVVVEGSSGCTWVGRYHERTDRGIVMHDVAVHDPAAASRPKEEWIARMLRFGVQVDVRHLTVPEEERPAITRLLEYSARS